VRAPASKAPRNAASTPPGPAASPAAAPDPERLVLIADAEPEMASACAAAVTSWGLTPLVVHDGVEAILAVQRSGPRAIIVDAALPRMFGFQVCEMIKRNESLRDIRVILIGSINRHERYRREPSDLYGADAYVERTELPSALRPLLRDLGVPVYETEAASARPDPAPAASRQPSAAPTPPVMPPPAAAAPAAVESPPVAPVAAPSAGDDALAPAIVQAEKLARVVVSDVVLYNPEKFDRAVRDGNVLEAMESEMQEARKLFGSRVDESVLDLRDYLAEELQRVAKQRAES
jgi:CheY-like chemotaxis protein